MVSFGSDLRCSVARWPAAPHDEGVPRQPPPARRRDRWIGAITKAVPMIVLRFLDAVSQGIGICWIIAVLKAATVCVGRVTEVAFPTACRTARVRH
jgi:hypothetical protein